MDNLRDDYQAVLTPSFLKQPQSAETHCLFDLENVETD